MALSSSALSETLQSITVTKIRELEKQKQTYNSRKDKIIEAANKEDDVRARLDILLDGSKTLCEKETSTERHNIDCWLSQSRFDPSLSEERLLSFEEQLRNLLDRGSRKLDLAHLYSRLLTEWIQSPITNDAEPDDSEGSGSDVSFEVVQDAQKARLEQLRDKFARVVFEPLETNEVEIDNYLTSLFEGEHGAKTLNSLRKQVQRCGERMQSPNFLLDDQSLRWCIKALLKNDLLNDEKKASLNDFLKDEAVLSEIRDVLNMRFRDLKDWEWNLGDDGMPVVPRQSLNGKWRVMMDEDVLQALLTHWIGTTWAVEMKSALKRTRHSARLWKQYTRLPEDENAKLCYYNAFDGDIGDLGTNVASERQRIYDEDFFMSPLPDKFFEEAGGYDDDDDEVPNTNDRKSPKDITQLLLRTLTTEVIMRRSLDGEVAVVQSDFQWFATGVAHTTTFAVLRFLGFPEEWITFFQKVLEPPLNMMDGNPVRTRKRGLPMAHVFEKLFGELILYFMDLAVAQNDGMMLYRFHDDLWLAGAPRACADAWRTMEVFAQVMGLEFNRNKTGSVYLTNGHCEKASAVLDTLPDGPVEMNFLTLDPERGCWIINQEHVRKHVEQLRRQLADPKSVLQWIKTWNSCIGRFFSYTFGEPAHCFGKDHINITLQTHTDIQNLLFKDKETGTTVSKHVKSMLSRNFDVDEVSDAFLFMPESLGGLGLKNPFVPLLLLRHHTCDDPEQHMRKYEPEEREAYDQAKKDFESLSEKERRKRYKAAFSDEDDEIYKPALAWEKAQTFLTFEEYSKYRECHSWRLHQIYTYLLKQPATRGMTETASLRHARRDMKSPPDGLGSAQSKDEEMLWTVQYFEDELIEKFGGLEVVDRALLPMGVLKALRSRKVTWQMVL